MTARTASHSKCTSGRPRARAARFSPSSIEAKVAASMSKKRPVEFELEEGGAERHQQDVGGGEAVDRQVAEGRGGVEDHEVVAVEHAVAGQRVAEGVPELPAAEGHAPDRDLELGPVEVELRPEQVDVRPVGRLDHVGRRSCRARSPASRRAAGPGRRARRGGGSPRAGRGRSRGRSAGTPCPIRRRPGRRTARSSSPGCRGRRPAPGSRRAPPTSRGAPRSRSCRRRP